MPIPQRQASNGLDSTSFILAALTASGGIAGFARTGSVPSIVAGCSVGLLCTFRSPIHGFSSRKIACQILTIRRKSDGLGGYRIHSRQPYGLELSLLASVVLGGSAIPRAIRLRKPVPVILSVIATFGMVTFGRALYQRA